jgi:hypothetical protein
VLCSSASAAARGRSWAPPLYLGKGWFIHSSGYGVALAPLDGRYRDGLAWARRPLAETGLA